MAALTGLLGDYGSDDESAASGQEVAGPPVHSPYNLLLYGAVPPEPFLR